MSEPEQPWGLTVAALSQFVYDEIKQQVPPERHREAMARVMALMQVALAKVCSEMGGDAQAFYLAESARVQKALDIVAAANKSKH